MKSDGFVILFRRFKYNPGTITSNNRKTGANVVALVNRCPV